MVYESESNSEDGVNSGAYVFRPTGPAVPIIDVPSTTIAKGPYVTEVYQEFSSYL